LARPKSIAFWFRRDLRLDDQRGLFAALSSQKALLPVFIFDENILSKLKNKQDRRVDFIHQTLMQLKEEIHQQGGQLLVLHGKPEELWPKIAKDYNLEAVHTNRDYEPYAIQRDQKVQKALKKMDVEWVSHKDQVIFEPGEVLKDDGKPYIVYTPFKKAWLKKLKPTDIKSLSRPSSATWYSGKVPALPTLKKMGFQKTDLAIPSKNVAKSTLSKYDKERDFPALDATTHLGLHLRFGTTSVRKCATAGKRLNAIWLSELIWREFFMQILFHFPHVVKSSFRPEYDNIKWRNNKAEFKKWCDGQTGYPIVDAGMRELNTTGYMHNRVRMVTASFLCKHLLIDWRWGEKYFAEKLLDFDLSANNGNWQWAAGTGCDAAPYFRVFNPDLQTDRFDKEHEYIKKWVPEYDTKNYPEPMVEHKMARLRAIETYKKGLKK
jgi:deoxyribodipyrimidine photo-lyase